MLPDSYTRKKGELLILEDFNARYDLCNGFFRQFYVVSYCEVCEVQPYIVKTYIVQL